MTVLAPEPTSAAILLESPDATSGHGRLRAQLEILVPSVILVILLLACFVWPLIYSIPNPVKGDLAHPGVPPFSPGHIFGTDLLGNDIMSRILYGGRVSFEVGAGTAAIGLIIGGGVGALAGYKGGVVELVLMRILEIFLALPSLVLAIIVSTYLGPSELHVIWAISFFSIPSFARLARANTLRLKEQTFMTAAKLDGASDSRILFRHVAPNITPPLVTFALLGVGVAIIVEAALSYLGLGVPAPGPSWGNMISTGQQNLTSNPYLVLIPSIFLFVTVLCLNLLGDALRTRWAA